MTKDKALRLALEALDALCINDYSGYELGKRDAHLVDNALTAIKEALAQPEPEPVAYFDWMPEGATHIAQIKVETNSGGRLEMRTGVFKYDNEVLMVYTTDNDNEYPGWRAAKECFYHLNFPVFPIPTTSPAAKLPAQPEPEPIAFVTGTHAGYFVVRPTDPAMVLPVNMALYTHPKEWQDLTDDEIEKMRHLIDWTADWSYGTFARAIEAKLKQKNGYAEEKNT